MPRAWGATAAKCKGRAGAGLGRQKWSTRVHEPAGKDRWQVNTYCHSAHGDVHPPLVRKRKCFHVNASSHPERPHSQGRAYARKESPTRVAPALGLASLQRRTLSQGLGGQEGGLGMGVQEQEDRQEPARNSPFRKQHHPVPTAESKASSPHPETSEVAQRDAAGCCSPWNRKQCLGPGMTVTGELRPSH